MPEAVICAPLRTPVGKFGGCFRDISASTLAATVIKEIVTRTGISGADVDDVILGQASPNGEAPAIGRVAALDAGLGDSVPGQQVDRRCGSGLQAIIQAVLQVNSGVSELVLAGGTESMSSAEFYATGIRWGVQGDTIDLTDRLARARVTAGGRNHQVAGGMLETAENLRREFAISREDQDAFAVQSHQRAVHSQKDGMFDREIVAVPAQHGHGETRLITTDEHPRANASIESLARLRPVRAAVDPKATVTAGNSSGQNDGAAVVIVTTPERAKALGLKPLARLASCAVAGVAPHRMGIGPVPASALALGKIDLTLDDMQVIELNEAFAAQALAVIHSWRIDPGDPRLNPRGSAIALGHPVGATGARILTTLVYELERRDARYGLETMCVGGGQGIAAVIERL